VIWLVSSSKAVTVVSSRPQDAQYGLNG